MKFKQLGWLSICVMGFAMTAGANNVKQYENQANGQEPADTQASQEMNAVSGRVTDMSANTRQPTNNQQKPKKPQQAIDRKPLHR